MPPNASVSVPFTSVILVASTRTRTGAVHAADAATQSPRYSAGICAKAPWASASRGASVRLASAASVASLIVSRLYQSRSAQPGTYPPV